MLRSTLTQASAPVSREGRPARLYSLTSMSRDAVERARNDLVAAYPPRWYGTAFTPLKRRRGGLFQTTGGRWTDTRTDCPPFALDTGGYDVRRV